MVTGLRRRCAAGYAALVGLLLAFLILPVMPAAASGGIWLATQQATFSATNKLVPSMATYRNHAYILWLGDVPPGKTTTQIFFTTNASGVWKTRLLSAAGPYPGGVVEGGPNVFMLVDPSIKRLYAIWANGSNGTGGIVMYRSDDEGATWQGPTIIVKNTPGGTISDNLALAVGGGTIAVAFDGNPHDFGIKPACPGGIADLLAVTYNGTAWSQLQDVTSCVATQSNGFRTQRLAYDETTKRFSLVALDDTNSYGLWYAQSSGTTWSAPVLTPMTHLVTGANNPYLGDYQVAAAGGTTYVAYANLIKPNAVWCCIDVMLGTHRSGQGWKVQRITHDPLNCQKFDVGLAALPGRIAIAYRWGGFCAKPEPPSGPREEYFHVLTGLPGHFQEMVLFKPKIPSSCLRSVLSTDGNVFRVLQTCSNNGVPGGNLFYTPEFDDVVGPTTHITGISAAGSGAIRVAWSAQDPTPGSGVAYSQVEVRVDGGAWQTVVAATQSSFIVYTHAQAGKTYTFRVRARDKVNNWGAWVTATIQAT
jgi:hypothetical protein